METELFEVRLDESGKRLLQRLVFWTKFFYVCTLITCVFDFLNGALVLRTYTQVSGSLAPIFKFEYLFNAIFLAVYAIMLPLQAWFFFRFSGKSNRAAQSGNSEAYNESFQWLVKHAVLASVLFAFNSLWAIVNTGIQLRIIALIKR